MDAPRVRARRERRVVHHRTSRARPGIRWPLLAIACALMLMAVHGKHSVTATAAGRPSRTGAAATGAVPPMEGTTVQAGGDLQAALDAGPLLVVLAPAATYERSGFTIRRSGTTIRGNGATIRGTSGPALYIPPGVHDVRIEQLTAASAFQAVVQAGDNESRTQRTLDQVPQRIVFDRIRVPTHRGKRAFEINAAHVELRDCEVADVYSPALHDSQAIVILNTPGPVLVEGGSYSAGSEVIMVGGDTIKIPGVIPADITVRNTRLWRPLSWRTDGVNRSVKNLFELKTGERVSVRNVVMEGSWKAAQDGYAIVITPRSGGAIRDVVFDNVTVRQVGAGLQVTGHNLATELPTPFRTTGIVVRRSTIVASRAEFGGRGILALLGMGPDTLEFDDVVFVGDGTSLLLNGDRERVGRIRLVNSLVTSGKYGLMGAGKANLDDWKAWLDALDVAGSTFSEAAPALKPRVPGNTFIDRAAFDAAAAPRLR